MQPNDGEGVFSHAQMIEVDWTGLGWDFSKVSLCTLPSLPPLQFSHADRWKREKRHDWRPAGCIRAQLKPKPDAKYCVGTPLEDDPGSWDDLGSSVGPLPPPFGGTGLNVSLWNSFKPMGSGEELQSF